MQARLDPAAADDQFAERDRQAKAPRPGAARVHVQNAVAFVDARLVRVSGDDDPHARSLRLDVELGEVVDRVHADVADLEELALVEALGPAPAVVVAAYRGHR